MDADSKNTAEELEEGAYYVWTQEQLKELLKEEYDLFVNTTISMNMVFGRMSLRPY